MGHEVDDDAAVDVRPFGMVVELLRVERGFRHEGEGAPEIRETQLAVKLAADAGPAGEPGEGGFDLVGREGALAGHQSSSWIARTKAS